MEFGYHVEDNLFALQEQLQNQKYKHGDYEAFTVFDPKQRSIHKAVVRDRMVHQALVNVTEPIFEKQFIYDSYSCRVEKGTHAGVLRLKKFLLAISCNNTKTVYVLKCDVRKFFDSVDHQILLALIRDKVGDKKALDLAAEIIKSFSKSPGKGLPLGNLTSQLFANVYLHELDRFVKFGLKEKQYVRYCDDFVIISRSKEHLEKVAVKINEFLDQKLALELHPNKVSIRTWNQGIDYLGYVLFPYCVVLRNKTKNRMLKKINQQNLSSYWGLCKHADTYHLLEQILNILA